MTKAMETKEVEKTVVQKWTTLVFYTTASSCHFIPETICLQIMTEIMKIIAMHRLVKLLRIVTT